MNLSGVSSRRGSYSGPQILFAGTGAFAQNRNGLKSTQEKIERQQKAGNQIAFWEGQKENLKNMQCDTLDEIARKLEMFHNYEEEIAAVKEAYNSEQIWHVMDEAREMGEKIAEAVEDSEPKTPEERQEEELEEITGVEKGELMEALDELLEDVENLADSSKLPEELENSANGAQELESFENKDKGLENLGNKAQELESSGEGASELDCSNEGMPEGKGLSGAVPMEEAYRAGEREFRDSLMLHLKELEARAARYRPVNFVV